MGQIQTNVLKDCSISHGVLYPVQTLRREMLYEPPTPMLIDGSNEQTIGTLQQFANTLSNDVKIAGDNERLKLHVAAVVVSNFTNHLLALAKDFCDHEKLDFSLLLPMIEETTRRLHDNEPSAMQTGPAVRNDFVTIEKHLGLLESYPQLLELYRLFTESIARYHHGTLHK